MDANFYQRISRDASVNRSSTHLIQGAGRDISEFITLHLNGNVNSVYEVKEHEWPGGNLLNQYDAVINKQPLNEYSDFNRYLLSVNSVLPDKGVFISCFECYESRNRIIELPLNNHADETGGAVIDATPEKRTNYKVKSLAEIFGRIVYCGFEIIDFRYFGNFTWFIVRKKSTPVHNKDPKFRMFIRLKRVGKNGNMFGMYKIRTMYPYSEYIQDYIVKINGLNPLGKPDKDFRLMRIGRVIRKVWIDEIPQILNLISGDMNIIGVRPISKFLYDSYPEDLQKARLKYKPGLIPPQIALREKGFAGVIKAERQYLSEMEKNPFRTNLKYLVIAVFNIITFRVKTS